MDIITDFGITLFWVVLTLTLATLAIGVTGYGFVMATHVLKQAYVRQNKKVPKNILVRECFWYPMQALGYLILVVERELWKFSLKTELAEVPNLLPPKSPTVLAIATGVWLIIGIGSAAYLTISYAMLWWWAITSILSY